MNIHDFFSLSAFLNYQLSGTPVNWRAVMTLMHPEALDEASDELVMEALMYLGEAYGQEKRKLGPLAVLHPIRTASLLSKTSPAVSTLDILTTLLHDKDEDITENKYCKEDWQKLEDLYQNLIRKIDSVEKWYLNERIHFLTRNRNETYHEYIDGLISQALSTPELIRVKLADRLDNTLDLRMDLYEDTSGDGCYRVIFEALFADTYTGPVVKTPHHSDRRINGAVRLYELYKNALLLSLLNERAFAFGEADRPLFDSLAVAGINEAQNVMLHIFTYHLRDTEKQRSLLLDVMEYCRAGRLTIAGSGGTHRLDRLFRDSFPLKQKERLTDKLGEIYEDKELMAEAAVAFIVIFTDFLNNPHSRIWL